jgi:trk system potassium uptake protein TrkA
MTLTGLNLEIVEVRVPQEARVVNQQVKQVLLPQGSLLCLVISEGTPRVPMPETMIHAEDILVAVTPIEAEESLRRALTESEASP